MYENPIEIVINKITEDIKRTETDYIVRAVKDVGINVNEVELLKALNYDRDQYRKGYSDAMKDKKELLDLIQDVNPAEIAAQIESGNLHNWCIIFRKEFERVLNRGVKDV